MRPLAKLSDMAGTGRATNPCMQTIELTTRDGVCPCYTYRPDAPAPWPAVLVYMDGLGIRPAMLEIGQRLAANGYFVLLPDLYYRSGPYEPMDPHAIMADPDKRKALRERFFDHATQANVMSDSSAFFDYLEHMPQLRPGRVGVVGYCRGGLMTLTAAGVYSQRLRAAASFHGGHLASGAPDSPHLLASNMTARVYIAGAIEDAAFPDDMKQRLESALAAAGVDHTIETYPARHGWVFRDTPVYDAAAAERHWRSLLSLFDATLKQP